MARTDPLGPIWKALADPTRRRALDLLRERARTTGELCDAFPKLSRFAVMKHLGVLERARLLTVRRTGRERWNHLNAVPLQEVHERWIGPFEARWASGLLDLRRGLEGETDVATKTKAKAKHVKAFEVGAIAIAQEIRIEAPAARVFAALCGDVAAWWGRPYVQTERPKAIALEARPGGRMIEEGEGGESALWATVTQIVPGERLELTGPMGMSGAVHGVIAFDLEKDGKATTLKLTHRAIGEVDAETQESYTGGWSDLCSRLKTMVEKGKRLGLGNEPEAPA